MEVTAKELRSKPGRIIEQAARGVEIVITLRGKKTARIVPYSNAQKESNTVEDDIFGLWKEGGIPESVDDYVRTKRKGRAF